MPEPAQSRCSELEGLQVAYRAAVTAWIDAGGAQADSTHLPQTKAAKEVLDAAADSLIEHRRSHGC